MLWKSNFNPLSDVFKCLKFKVCFLARFFSCKPLENQSNPFDGRKNQIMWKNAQTGKMQICWFFTVTFNQTGTVPQYSTISNRGLYGINAHLNSGRIPHCFSPLFLNWSETYSNNCHLLIYKVGSSSLHTMRGTRFKPLFQSACRK